MRHYWIISCFWLFLGIAGLVFSGIECVSLLRLGDSLSDGSVISTLIAGSFCMLATFGAVGLLRMRRWSRDMMPILASLLCLYLLSFLGMVAMEFGVVAYISSWLGVVFVVDTLWVIWRVRNHHRHG